MSLRRRTWQQTVMFGGIEQQTPAELTQPILSHDGFYLLAKPDSVFSAITPI